MPSNTTSNPPESPLRAKLAELLEKLALQCDDYHDPAVLYNERHEIAEALNAILLSIESLVPEKLDYIKFVDKTYDDMDATYVGGWNEARLAMLDAIRGKDG